MLLLAAAPAQAAGSDLGRGFSAYRAGDYATAAHVLANLSAHLPRNKDYALFLLAESQFYDGAYAKARTSFGDLAKLKDSRWAALAPWRVADCLWMEGRTAEAGAGYRKLLAAKAAGGDVALARFRLAELASEGEARKLFMQVHVDYPAHPLSAEAARRAGADASAGGKEVALAPRDRLRRANALADGHDYQAALDELAKLPAELPEDLVAERDFAIGMAKYKMRRDYAGASELLLRASHKLPGDKAAFAAFHGARALSRLDRDDDAVVAYGEVVKNFPTSKWAAEAQFRAGWLEVNRGHFRDALPGLRATLTHFSHSAFGNDAAWYLALSHYLLDQPEEALRALEQYERLSKKGDDVGMRVAYWRARFVAKTGNQDEARRLLRACAEKGPLTYYGLLAAARLREGGEKVPAVPALSAKPDKTPLPRDPLLERVEELRQAGLDVEGGVELQRGEAGLIKRLGKARGMAVLLNQYPRLQSFSRAYYLAETHGLGAFADAPALFWHSAYPRAYADLVSASAKEASVPELFVYSIMRKESGYAPHEVSYADARGLLQLIPGTGSQAAAKLKTPFFADQLFDPEINVRLGTYYVAGLYKRFRDQFILAAGAYNAGPNAMKRWCDQWGQRPLDEFVELVTYDQAREYMKRVTGIYARYRQLYGQPLDLPLTVNAQYLKDGPDY